jgi:hypothetical protein
MLGIMEQLQYNGLDHSPATRHRNAFEQAALDPAIASRARKGEFVRCLTTSACYRPR